MVTTFFLVFAVRIVRNDHINGQNFPTNAFISIKYYVVLKIDLKNSYSIAHRGKVTIARSYHKLRQSVLIVSCGYTRFVYYYIN